MAERKLNKAVVDALLIVFSVLLALMLNKSFDAWQEHKKMKDAERAVKSEISMNQSMVKSLIDIHLKIQQRLNSLVNNKNDSIRSILLQGKYFNFWVILNNKSFLPVFPASTAWETARATGIISEFNYDEVQELTFIFNQQEIVYKGTVAGIVNTLYNRETNDLHNLDGTLIELKLRFDELILQEQSLMALYKGFGK